MRRARPTWSRRSGTTRSASCSARLRPGDLDGAEAAFRDSLKAAPNNGWALYGLSKVQSARGDTAAADATADKWREVWVGDELLLSLERL